MRSRLRAGLSASVLGLLPWLAASCSYQRSYDFDPVAGDYVNTIVAVDAQNRGDDAATVRAYERILANTGHPLAELQLGRYYAEGRGTPKNPVKAAMLLRDAYEKDWPRRGEAAYYLARLYDEGQGVPLDKKKAFELFSFAHNSGVTLAAYPLAKAFEDGVVATPNRDRAYQLYQEAAVLNDGRAAMRLAELDDAAGANPLKVMVEAKPGIAWLKDLAKQDNDWAEMRLATIYDEGKFAPSSPELAERYLRDAAKHGNAGANARMADRAEKDGDAKKALAYWQHAADGGYPSGMVKVGYADLEAGRVGDGLEWLQKAAALGHPSAMVEIGRRELTGDGVPANQQAGLAMLRQAVELGHPSAMVEIGRRELTGDGVAADPTDAVALLVKAANLGHPSAMYTLGEAYANGQGVRKDPAAARGWLEKAQAAGHPSAAKALADLQPQTTRS